LPRGFSHFHYIKSSSWLTPEHYDFRSDFMDKVTYSTQMREDNFCSNDRDYELLKTKKSQPVLVSGTIAKKYRIKLT
jgi:hypothetical protein